ncbi:MAG: hypothetical protein AB1801_20870 [Chloroflexota bacterium]
MRRRVILEVVTPHAGMLHHMPGGFAYANEILTEAGFGEQVNKILGANDETLWLRRCLYYLERRFQRWLQVQLIEPFSLLGLLRVIRHRIRTYPTFILGGKTYTGHDLAELEAFIRRQAGAMTADTRWVCPEF